MQERDMGSCPLFSTQERDRCRWTYKVKYIVDGSVNCYNARLVAKGYAQTQEVDCEETFALVAKMMIVRTVIALAAAKGWHLPTRRIRRGYLHDSTTRFRIEQTSNNSLSTQEASI